MKHSIQLSKYIRIFDDIRKESVLYNTRNRAIVLLPDEFKKKHDVKSVLSPFEIQSLRDMLFFDESISKEENDYNSSSNCIISIETMLDCNLRCPYCYQIGAEKHGYLSDENIEYLMKYVRKVWEKVKFDILTVKILGGEPTLLWDKSKRIIDLFSETAKELHCDFHLMIDTNGTVIKDLIKLKNIPNILFTIPLSFKSCHDSVRKFPSGEGSYHIIIDNINRLKKELPHADIVLRYNVDESNLRFFERYIFDLKVQLSFNPIISPNYTMDLGKGGFKNKLSHKDYILWLSTECIDILLNNDLPIIITPFTLSEPCQYLSKYSLKIFSDGTIGACAMSFFKDERITIKELLEDFSYLEKSIPPTPFNNSICRNCESLFICGGSYHIPCIKSLGLSECSTPEVLHVSLKDFLSRYLSAKELGKDNLFVGFNEYNTYK